LIGKWIQGWADRRQQKELHEYLRLIQNMDDDELGMTLALAIIQRHKLHDRFGWNLLDPSSVWLYDSGATLKLVNVINQMKTDGQQVAAGPLMIWAHTLRAMSPPSSPQLRNLGRGLWLELSRGFPHVPKQAEAWFLMSGYEANTDGYDRFPEGLAPTGRSTVLRHP
jgi:hypothetical protein